MPGLGREMLIEAFFSEMISRIVQIVLGVLFLVSGILKVGDLRGFASVIESYGILQGRVARLAGFTQPFFEMGIGGLLLSGHGVVLGALLGFVNVAVATYFVGSVLMKKKRLENLDVLVPALRFLFLGGRLLRTCFG